MAIDTNQLSADIADAIAEVPVTVYIRREIRISDPDTGEVVVQPPTDSPWTSTPLLPYSVREVDGDAILREDSRLLMAAVSTTGTTIPVVPVVGDDIIFKYGTDAQQVWRVMNVKHYSAGDIDQVSAYDIQVRRR